MAGLPSSSEGPGLPHLRTNEVHQLNQARSARPSSSRGPLHYQRAPSRGRSRARRNRPVNQRGKGSLAPSRLPMDKGKGRMAVDSSPSASPAAHSPRTKGASKVFDKMPPPRGAPQTRSWAAVAKSATKGYSLSYIPPSLVGTKMQVSISEDMLESSDPKWEECLVGYLIGKKLPFKLVETALKHAWGPKLIDVMANDDGFFFFHLPDNEVRKEILEGGPLTIAKVPLVLQQWHALLNLEKKKHETVPIWIRLRNIPYSLWSAIGISAIASAIGKPLYVDSQTEKMRMISYARVCVEIRAGVGLPDIVEVALLDELRTVKVEYEWRPSYCPSCISFGHRCPDPQQKPVAPLPAEQNSAEPSSAQKHHGLNTDNPASTPGDWVEVQAKKSSSKTKSKFNTGLIQECTVPVKDTVPVQQSVPVKALLPGHLEFTTSSVSEDSNQQDVLANDSEEDQASLVPSTLPELDCPPAPLRDTRRSGRSAPQVLGLPSSSIVDVQKPGDPSKLRSTRNRR